MTHGDAANVHCRVSMISRSAWGARLVSASMERLCGRPGCSDLASVAYGMRAEDLVFWLDVLPEDDGGIGGVLCRRHADSMIVPRGWTLDDLRDPELHLFRPPNPTARVRTHRPSTARSTDATGEQLRLPEELLESVPDQSIEPSSDAPSDAMELGDPGAIDDLGDIDDPGPWTPSFDEADDLDGLLSARSPLLSRAFRTADRPDT
jgi:hypothetical protein